MARRKQLEIKCEVTFSEGAIDRITQAFVDLYYGIQDGLYEYNGPPLDGRRHKESEEHKQEQQDAQDETA